jgi:bla regulator protein BlaR1
MTTDLFTNGLGILAQQWVAFSLVLSVQLLLVLALRKPVRARFGAVACYRLWLLPVAWLPLYFLGPLPLAALATPAPVGGAPGSATAYQQALQQFVEIELLPFTFDDVGSTPLAASGDTKIHGWNVLAVLWAAGTVALMVWHGRRWLNFSREVRALGLPLNPIEKAYTGTSAHFAEELPVLRMTALNSAALFGVFKPVLLLPGTFTQRYDENQRHIILAHEAVHLRRGDNGINLVALMLIALFWTNPLIFIAWRYFRLDQELSCDALALTRCNREQQKRYARTLLDSLGSLSPYSGQPALSAWDDLRDIKERSLMVNQHMHLVKRPLATVFSLLSLAALGASLTVAFADLVSPVVEAAEPTQPLQVVQQRAQQARRAAQESREDIYAAQQDVQQAQVNAQAVQQAQAVTQQEQQDVQGAMQVAQAATQAVQEAQQEVQVLQQEVQQASAQAPQATQDAAPEVQQMPAPADEAQAAPQPMQLAQAAEPSRPPRALTGGTDHIRDDESAEPSPSQIIDLQTGNVLSEAIRLLNDEQYPQARERLGNLRIERLSNFERSRYEQLMFNLDMVDENYAGARGHLQAAIDSGGLNPQEKSVMAYQQARLYVQEENYVQAAAALENWIASAAAPSSDAFYLLAASYYYLDQLELALAHAEKADALDKLNGVAVESHLKLLVAIYTQLGRSADAERVKDEMPQLFQDPVPVARVNPDYPKRALRMGLEGWVKVRYSVDETGAVVDAVVVESKPRRVFDEAAIDAVSHWQYDPKIEDGVPVQYAGGETTFRFTLADSR